MPIQTTLQLPEKKKYSTRDFDPVFIKRYKEHIYWLKSTFFF